MNLLETGDVLAKIQVFDNRTVDQATLAAWQEVLAGRELQECLDAVAEHHRTSTAWVMPGHITAILDAKRHRGIPPQYRWANR